MRTISSPFGSCKTKETKKKMPPGLGYAANFQSLLYFFTLSLLYTSLTSDSVVQLYYIFMFSLVCLLCGSTLSCTCIYIISKIVLLVQITFMQYIEHMVSTHSVSTQRLCASWIEKFTYILKFFFRPPIRLIFIVIELLLHEISFNLKITMYIETLVVSNRPSYVK